MKQTPAPHQRPNWDEYFMEIVAAVALRATCDRGRSGCVITRENRIVATGYVGAPPGMADCDEVGHELIDRTNSDGSTSSHCIRTSHAEENAIVHAARFGSSLAGSTVYCRMTPCYTCAKMIVTAGIVRVVCQNDYHAGTQSKQVFKEAGILFELLDSSIAAYDKQKKDN